MPQDSQPLRPGNNTGERQHSDSHVVIFYWSPSFLGRVGGAHGIQTARGCTMKCQELPRSIEHRNKKGHRNNKTMTTQKHDSV